MDILTSTIMGIVIVVLNASASQLHVPAGQYIGIVAVLGDDWHSQYELAFEVGSAGEVKTLVMAHGDTSTELSRKGSSWKYSITNLKLASATANVDIGRVETELPDVPHVEFHFRPVDAETIAAESDTLKMILGNGYAVLTGSGAKDIKRVVIAYWPKDRSRAK